MPDLGMLGPVPYPDGSVWVVELGRLVFRPLGDLLDDALPDTGVTPGSYPSSTSFVPTFTVDSKGRLTAAGSTTIDAAAIGSGTLGAARGGTGLTGGTSGGVLTWTGAAWASSAALAQNQLVLGGGGGAVPATLGSLGTTHQVLHGNAAGAPTWSAVDLTADVSGDLPFANLAQGAALSVLGVTGNAIADVASIAAGSDYQVLRRSGTALAFGAVDLSQSAAVTGDLAFANLAQITGLSVLGVTGTSTADVAALTGTANQVLRVNSAGSALAFGAVNLASSAAVTGNLPVTNLNSGTSAGSTTFWRGDGTWATPTASGVGAIGGTISAGQVAHGDTTANTIKGLSTFVFDGTNLGVGIATPNYNLHLNGGAGAVAMAFTGQGLGTTTADGFAIAMDGSATADKGSMQFIQQENVSILFYTNNAGASGGSALERMRISAGGLVGIGTGVGNTPATKLHVKGAGGTASSLRLESTASNQLYLQMKHATQDWLVGVDVGNSGGTDLFFYNNTGGANRLALTTGGQLDVIPSGTTNHVILGANSTYGVLTFNGSIGAGELGLTAGGGTDKNLYHDVPTGGTHLFRIQGTTVATLAGTTYTQSAGPNGDVGIGATNTNNGTSASAYCAATDSTGTFAVIQKWPAAWTSGAGLALFSASGGASYSNGSGGYVIAATHASGVITFGTGGTTSAAKRWQIDASGHFIAATDNTFDIGASGATRPRNVYVAGSVTIGTALGAASGGTGIASYAVGDLLYASGSTTLAKLADVAAGSYLRSGGVTTAPVWSTLTLPNTAAVSTLLYASSANVMAALPTANYGLLNTSSSGVPSITATPLISTSLEIGKSGTATGALKLSGTTSGTVTVTTAAAAGTWTLTLPNTAGGAGQLIMSDGTTWGYLSGTSGGVPYFSSSTAISSSAALGATQIVIGGGAGAAPATNPYLYYTDTQGLVSYTVDDTASISGSGYYGAYGEHAAGTKAWLYGVEGEAFNEDAGDVALQWGAGGYAEMSGSGTVADMAALFAFSNSRSGGTVARNSGLLIQNQAGVSAAANYAIAYDGAAAGSSFAVTADGRGVFGGTSPTAGMGVDIQTGGFRVATSASPASGGAGTAGTVTWDANYIYVCTAANTWKRAALTGGY